jgi:hypothetical protein
MMGPPLNQWAALMVYLPPIRNSSHLVFRGVNYAPFFNVAWIVIYAAFGICIGDESALHACLCNAVMGHQLHQWAALMVNLPQI